MVGVVRSADVAAQPWANGGGTTRTLLGAPDGAWRISLADIDRPGAFSTFAGQDRLLTVVDGPVLTLDVDGRECHVEPLRPFAFAGEAEVHAVLPEGPVRALNLIADRGHALAATVLELSRGSALPLAEDQAAYVVQGHPTLASGGAAAASRATTEAGPGDLAVGPGLVSGRARVLVVTVSGR